MTEKPNLKKKNDTLEYLRLEMLALGLKKEQADRIIDQSLSGRDWGDLNDDEKNKIAVALQERINLTRRFLAFLSCPDCQL
ncbi:MAG: hypothetical protein K6T29_03155 [Peptococcaceae bacterium]|nr:hypothetical protein [Peptococcaceae bacterium]